ncbi:MULTISPECIES: recombination regulator RecX [Bacillaceae]|uniref:Regulatory protein RecX n=1 Tax=Niallia hominis TaxID=3133173 RepID=A0ABV1F0T9_9BACI|nr:MULTISPECIES: recombination regulator RecX [unclassified Bacillus (in: firmicutes)]CAI9395555.1 Regulatory protein RecX [Bacillus sp. T2.9-1]
MIISKITRQKELNDRYNIFTIKQGKEVYAFSVDEAVLVKYQLQKGMELDSLLLNEIQYTDEIRKGYHMAVRYLAKVKRTEMEVRKHLLAKMENESFVSEVMMKLKDMKFIDDEDYAFSYVRTQRNTTTKGPESIKRELKEKGVQIELIERAMEEFAYEDQLQSAQKVMVKFLAGKKKDSKKILLQKLEQTLVRKGFTTAIIQEVKRMPEILEMDSDGLETIRIHGEKARRKFAKFTGYEFTQKMKQFLYRKGFSMDLIEQYLDEMEEEM